jgi:excisionase family DNA binding protein
VKTLQTDKGQPNKSWPFLHFPHHDAPGGAGYCRGLIPHWVPNIRRSFRTTHLFIRGKRPRTIQKGEKSMSILKKLRERTEPLNVGDLAQLLNVTQTTVLRWVRRRQIPAVRIGDTIRFDPGMLADWVELQAACTLPPRTPRNPDDDQLHWQDLGELEPEEAVRTPGITQRREATKTEPQ